MFQSVIEDIKRRLPSYKRKERKSYLRSVLAQRRRTLTAEEVEKCSKEVVAQIVDSQIFRNAQTIMLYYPMHNEIDLRKIVELVPNKHYLLPVVHRKTIEVREYSTDNLKRSKLGVLEPQTLSYKGNIDLIIIPGVGFDKHNVRLGRGGGYYDRFLSNMRNSFKMGVCYGFQVVNEIPFDHHDKKMDVVISSKSK